MSEVNARNPLFPNDGLSSFAQSVLEAGESDFRERGWDIHGVGVRLAADHDIPLRCADRLLGVFPVVQTLRPRQIRLVLTSRRQWVVPAEAEVLPPSSHELIDPREEYGVDPRFSRWGPINYYAFPPMGAVAYDLARGFGVGGLVSPESHRPWLMEHLVLQILLLEMLRGQDLFWLHSACVAHGGRAVLLVGPSGSGKTTSCLNLAGHGFEFLGEDRVFLRSDHAQTSLLAYPRDMAVTRETLSLLPFLRECVGAASFSSRKLRVAAATLFPGRREESAKPGLILFPRVVDAARTTFQPLPAAAALRRILPNSLLASHPAVSARHFQALSKLASGSRAFEVAMGRDIEAFPELVLGVLESGAAS